MHSYLAEFLGTTLLVLLGDGVVANVLLSKTKGHNGGLIVITAGWAFAVTIALYCFGRFSGGHFNPAITIGLTAIGQFNPLDAFFYVVAQMLGGIVGATLVWLAYLPHWAVTPDPATKLGVFCNSPAIAEPYANLMTEVIGTAVLMIGALAIPPTLLASEGWSAGFGPFLIGILVWSIGVSLGGPTGYAINPARDLGPRLAHAMLPIAGKGGSDWSYAWIPVVGPIIGGVLGAILWKIVY